MNVFRYLFCRCQHGQCQHGDLIEVFKIVNGYYDIDPTKFFTLTNATNTRGHHMKVLKLHTKLNA